MLVKRLGMVMLTVVCVFAHAAYSQVRPADITVCQTCTGDDAAMFRAIQPAIDAAKQGQIIEILDLAVYEEQITIEESAKHGITLRSKNPASREKPVIKWQDVANRSPKNYPESQNPALSRQYQQCGALRIINAQGVTIDGIAIDGGGAAPFSWPNVWETKYALFHGNAAIAVVRSGATVIRNCDLRNAYFGVYVMDNNAGGIYTRNPTDLDLIPLGYPYVGYHLIEHNRIHNNSAGLFFESLYDLGTTVRYNLIYNNYHGAAPLSGATVNAGNGQLTGVLEAGNRISGAFLFKDVSYVPVAIYNNTFYNNTGNFFNDWKAGNQHLIFNNIYGKPYKYSGTVDYLAAMSVDGNFPNRMNNSLFFEPVPNTPPHNFPASANVRRLDTEALFLSTDPADSNYLHFDWADPQVEEHIKNEGWGAAGMRNSDGPLADIGAVPSSGARQATVVRIRPTDMVLLGGVDSTLARANFFLMVEGSQFNNPRIKFLRWIAPLPYKTADTWWGSATDPIIPEAYILDIPTPNQLLRIGFNEITFSLGTAVTVPQYSFFEIVVEGDDESGNPVTSDVGFLPCYDLLYSLEIRVCAATATTCTDSTMLREVTAGEPVKLFVEARGPGKDTPFTQNIGHLSYNLQSDANATMFCAGGENSNCGAADTVFQSDCDLLRQKEYLVYFTQVGEEVIMGNGMYEEENKVLVFLGTRAITVKPGNISVKSTDRVIPPTGPNAGVSVVAPVNRLTSEFVAGPNPAMKSAGMMNFYYDTPPPVGATVSGRLPLGISGVLTVYGASGKVVNKIQISDKTIALPSAADNQARRQVGSWDLRDRRGRGVAEGAYLVKGTITAWDGRKEKISLVVGVR